MFALRYLLSLILSLLVSAQAFGAIAHGWVIVTGENPPNPVADNADALQKELSDLTRQSIPVVTCSSMTEEQLGQANLILKRSIIIPRLAPIGRLVVSAISYGK